jgi:hypothetical protein
VIKSEGAGFAEEGVNALGVDDRGARGVAVIFADALLFGHFRRNGGIPEELTIGEVETKKMAFEF